MTTFGCTLELAAATLDLQAGLYKLESSSAGERTISMRKTVAKNRFVEGEFTVDAVQEQVSETVAVWVTSTSAYSTRMAVETLRAGFQELSYLLHFTQDDVMETWSCQPAELRIQSNQPLRFATKALVTATVPRRPTITFAAVGP